MDKNLVYLIIFFIYCFNHIAKIEKKFELYNFLMIFFSEYMKIPINII